ncbi:MULTISPECIES: PstS family phosphate ABC transporter substrate-binding protein [unclassified Thermosynechococcus]|uniref:PstS family phosphate ABC transporter substrate-binding protein n=1 Tax=unclassified Thermosynechococcus TaxID=2622553 RepID=UPI002858EC99|nr:MULTISPECIES: PstS family phosphate ABC transporter substrate-binding protein [unclassified Thermosynechococcus]MDR5637792.1 PstS family phosphate ABC transporter substrate-binding protein [Thermosynechococcus sp. PP42]MDR7920584.1 PstS family phosphate ABC transporter substrate-binding protein [Thermosynechococcus sp. HY213]WNC22293.1 PstS family phosphate ABC transporter substrate-binding protein [Thermosynechococcus sp. PP22]WNC32529.1 PstS family phosphate ABC transporter substrate-bindi
MFQGKSNSLLPLLLSLLATLGLLGIGAGLVLRLINNGEIIGNGGLNLGTKGQSTFTQVKNVPSGLFNYGGSTTWAPIRRDVDPLLQAAWPNFQLRYVDPPTGTPGSGSGIRMLLNHQLSFSQSSRSLKDEELAKAAAQGIKLTAIPVAIDGLAIAVNPRLEIPGLTVQQVVDIYTGKVTNWQQVGGPNQKITPFSRRPEDGGTVEYFIQEVLGKQPFGRNVVMVRDTTDGLRRVAATLGGIYYASAPEVVGQCSIHPLPLGRQANEYVPPYQDPYVPPEQCPQQRNQLNQRAFQEGTYPITRRLFVITKEDNSLDAQAGRAYAALLLTDQGQAAIEKAGFVRLR